jgi:phospholipid N-methyltransferase
MSTIPKKRPSSVSRVLLFATNFVKHPRLLGSIVPSSPFLINRVLRPVNWRTARVLVEYGPGTGEFTQEILRRMHPDATLLAIELNPDFVTYLKANIADPRLRVVHGSAADVGTILAQQGLGQADYIVSGIPLTTLPRAVKDGILRAAYVALRPGGKFLVFQFSPISRAAIGRVFKQVTLRFEPLNIPPATVFYCDR